MRPGRPTSQGHGRGQWIGVPHDRHPPVLLIRIRGACGLVFQGGDQGAADRRSLDAHGYFRRIVSRRSDPRVAKRFRVVPTRRCLGTERVVVFGYLRPRQGENAEQLGGPLDQRTRLDQRSLQTDGVQPRDKFQVVERRLKAVVQLRRDEFEQNVFGPS